MSKPKNNPFQTAPDPDQVEKQAIREWKSHSHATGIKLLLAASILLSVVSTMNAMTASSQIQQLTQAQTAQQTSDSSGDGRIQARQAAQSWLDTVYGADGWRTLQWESSKQTRTSTTGDASKGEETHTTRVHQHSYTFTDSTGAVRTLTVSTQTVDSGTPTVTGEPTIGARLSYETGAAEQPSGYASLSVSTRLQSTVEQWAAAWTGYDSGQLTTLTGDPDTGHEFQAANLGAYTGAEVEWSVTCDETGAPSDGDAWGLAAVTVGYQPDRLDAVKEDDGVQSASTSLVLLIREPDGGSPLVVDWEPSGSFELGAWSNWVADAVDVEPSTVLEDGVQSDDVEADAVSE